MESFVLVFLLFLKPLLKHWAIEINNKIFQNLIPSLVTVKIVLLKVCTLAGHVDCRIQNLPQS